jgi:hypothetical protein
MCFLFFSLLLFHLTLGCRALCLSFKPVSSGLLTQWTPRSSVADQNETMETDETNATEYFW